jgi:hypothetical protein
VTPHSAQPAECIFCEATQRMSSFPMLQFSSFVCALMCALVRARVCECVLVRVRVLVRVCALVRVCVLVRARACVCVCVCACVGAYSPTKSQVQIPMQDLTKHPKMCKQYYQLLVVCFLLSVQI